MSAAELSSQAGRKPLRIWPGIAIVVLQWLARFVMPVVAPDTMQYGVIAGLLGGVAVVSWWLFFSRAPWSERLGGLALMAVALVTGSMLIHESVATGMMGMMFPLYAIPVLSLAFVAWAVLGRELTGGTRWLAMAVAILAACWGWALVKTGGFTADLDHDFAWRWSRTAEDRLLAEAADEPVASSEAVVEGHVGSAPVWSGFRGPKRDGVVPGVRIATDWSTQPPEELWRRPIGPGWSSFAVDGSWIYTQEQRGEEEVVSCYHAETGEPVWMHRDEARFWESNGGAGPRSTPTLHKGRVYTLGGTGILNALDARDGSVIWSRNAAEDTAMPVPMWGFSGSPLIFDPPTEAPEVDGPASDEAAADQGADGEFADFESPGDESAGGGLVIVAASGALVAYDLDTGEQRWVGPSAGEGYSSPHLVEIDGITQVLQLNGDGLVSVSPIDGELLWQHDQSGYPIVQPAMTPDGDVLISVDDRGGLHRISPQLGSDGWTVEKGWTTIGLKPYSSDFVVHKGHAYGFDGNIMSCVDLKDGERKWKGGRYGLGQLVLLPDQDLMVVVTEKGKLTLVRATPDSFDEVASIDLFKGKTWNHPVLVDDLLLIRNGEQMVAFRLALKGN